MADPQGLPSGAKTTPVPNLFFSEILPLVNDLAELKVTLHLLWRLAGKACEAPYVTLREMRSDLDLLSGLSAEGDPQVAVEKGLEAAVRRGLFLRLEIKASGKTETLVALNDPVGQRFIAQARAGKLDVGGLPQPEQLPAIPQPLNIFQLYEENIGVLSPLLADELKEAENLYPHPWIVDAFKEAVRLNHRSWRYVQRILENWQSEGRSHGVPQRAFEAVQSSQPVRKRGGHIVRRRQD